MPSRRRRVRETLQRRLADVCDLAGVLDTADAVLRAALGAQGSAWGTVDPATLLSTSCARFGELDTGPAGWAVAAARERRLFELEWADQDLHTFWDLSRRQVTAAALRAAAPELRQVRRYEELLAPAGVYDELRLRLAVDGQQWATAIFYRLEQRSFTTDLIMQAMGFTPREREVTEALLHGASRTQLARRLEMSEHTVGDHLRNLYRKAGVAGRGELAALVYGRHYEPLRSAGVPPGPYGYFVGPGTAARTAEQRSGHGHAAPPGPS